ncbi:NAD(P)H-dependent oxidoreductase [Acinetobacter guillouiae]
MKCLVVIAHPVTDSLCQSLAKTAIATLIANGHEVVIEDLYASGFSPALTDEERQSYYSPTFDQTAVKENIDDLLSAEALILVFPTWWFGFPAILKGWFDRIWAPGVAYDHANDLGAIQPKLDNLKYTLAITSLGSAWWVDRLVL